MRHPATFSRYFVQPFISTTRIYGLVCKAVVINEKNQNHLRKRYFPICIWFCCFRQSVLDADPATNGRLLSNAEVADGFNSFFSFKVTNVLKARIRFNNLFPTIKPRRLF